MMKEVMEMGLVMVVSPKGWDGHGPEAWGWRHRKRTRRRIPRLPRRSHWGPPALRVLELPEIL